MRCARCMLVVGVSALVISGCATVESFTPPDVTLVDIELEDLTVFETSGTFRVRLSNENPDPLAVDGAVYKLFLGGRKVGRALSDARVEVPRLGSKVYEVDVFINNVALVSRLLTLGEETGLDYTVKGKLYVERPYGLRRIRFSRDGRIDLSGPGAKPLPAAVPEPRPDPDRALPPAQPGLR